MVEMLSLLWKNASYPDLNSRLVKPNGDFQETKCPGTSNVSPEVRTGMCELGVKTKPSMNQQRSNTNMGI